MKPTFFGDSHDMAKRQIMQWLAPNEIWAAHPMWYYKRPEPAAYHPFLDRYKTALNVRIVDRESGVRKEFLEAAQACEEHLLLDPDTGLQIDDRRLSTHVAISEFIQIVKRSNRQCKLTLIYDHSSYRDAQYGDIWEQTKERLTRLYRAKVHAVTYMAHEGSRVRFTWASDSCELITKATRRMQEASRFPSWRFVDDGCAHKRVDNLC